MTAFVIDASVAVEWVVEESDTEAALVLLRGARLSAPDLLLPECANVLWKKVRRRNLTVEGALAAAHVLARAEVELVAHRPLFLEATRIALQLDHAAYDCTYLALALDRGCRFVTADKQLVDMAKRNGSGPLRTSVVSIAEAASALAR